MINLIPKKDIIPYFTIIVWGSGRYRRKDETFYKTTTKNTQEITFEQVAKTIEILYSLKRKRSYEYPLCVFDLLSSEQKLIINDYIPQDEKCLIYSIDGFEINYVDANGQLHDVDI